MIALASRRSDESLASLLSPDDSHLAPLLDHYDDARDRDLRGRDRRFIVEGERVVRRFLRSSWRCESILATPDRATEFAALVDERAVIFAADDATMTSISGYRFHGGALAIGEREWHPPSTSSMLARLPRSGPARLLVAEDVVQVDNVGALFRNVACFGGQGVLLDGGCADPLLRKTIRFSMGRVFDVPWGTSRDLVADLAALKELDVAIVALEIAPNATPLRHLKRRDRVAFVVGSEARGLSAQTLAACDEVVMIPGATADRGDDVRSLNVGVAAGIALYEAVR